MMFDGTPGFFDANQETCGRKGDSGALRYNLMRPRDHMYYLCKNDERDVNTQ